MENPCRSPEATAGPPPRGAVVLTRLHTPIGPMVAGAPDAGSQFAEYITLSAEWNAVSDGPHAAPFYSISRLSHEKLDWFHEDLTALFDLLASGALKPKVSRIFPLEEAAAAHQLYEDRQVRGKLVLRLAEDPG